MTLTEFLLARIAEDESLARMAFGDHNDNEPDWSEPWSGAVDMKGEDLLLTNDSGVSRHIVNWSPARVLAECEAKRRIVERCVKGLRCDMECLEDHGGNFDDILEALALPYSDHPDYQDDWRPRTL